MLSGTHIKLEKIDDVAVIIPQGDLERYQEALLTHLFSSLINTNTRKVVIDLSNVNHAHYELLLKLTEVVTLFRGMDGDLLFAAASPYLKKIFQAVDHDKNRVIFNSLGEALLSFSEQTFPSERLH